MIREKMLMMLRLALTGILPSVIISTATALFSLRLLIF